MIFNQYHCNARYRSETVHEVVKPYMDERTNYGKIIEWKRQQGDRVKGKISYFLKEKSDRESEREREKVREMWCGRASKGGGEREQVCLDISIPSSIKPLQQVFFALVYRMELEMVDIIFQWKVWLVNAYNEAAYNLLKI
jgi:hypothetical protein